MNRQPYGKEYGNNAEENYERFFVPAIGRPVADDLMQLAALRPGERVLDVGCGTGVVTRLAAERTGRTVAGLDLNPVMLEVARSVTPPDASIEWHQSSAEGMPLPDEAFDAVLCQMSLQFVPDKIAAIREMHRVLAPGGRLVLNLPGRINGVFRVMQAALGRHLGSEAAGFLGMVFSLHDPGEVRDLLAGARFRDVEVDTTSKTLRLPVPAEFLWQYLHSTPLAEALRSMDDERLGALEEDMVESSRDLVVDGEVEHVQEFVVGTARKER